MSAQYKSEYHGAATNGPACSYNTNCNYYGQGGGTMAALRPGTVAGKMVVPGYEAIGYDALTHGKVGSCSQYFSINDAYGDPSCKTSYLNRLCGGCNKMPGEDGGGVQPGPIIVNPDLPKPGDGGGKPGPIIVNPDFPKPSGGNDGSIPTVFVPPSAYRYRR